MFKIPGGSFTALARILRLPGTDTVEGLQDEVVPVYDLNRVLQDQRVSSYFYQFGNTPAATAALTLSWNDLSDWTTVRRNGILVADDAGLPALTDERVIVAIGLQLSGTQADYTDGAAVYRFMPSGHTAAMREFGTIKTTTHRGPAVEAPDLLPQWLVPTEVDVNLIQIVSGIAAVFNWSVQMISAEPGVMSKFSGI